MADPDAPSATRFYPGAGYLIIRLWNVDAAKLMMIEKSGNLRDIIYEFLSYFCISPCLQFQIIVNEPLSYLTEISNTKIP